MRKLNINSQQGLPGLYRDQRGITGLETAIVLIAFVVVASVFAFAVLSTGLLSSEKSKETVLGGLAETSSTLSIRGDGIGTADSTKAWLDSVTFTLTSAAQAGLVFGYVSRIDLFRLRRSPGPPSQRKRFT